ncbi:MAG: baseplate J/gp47 family protein [Lachnospiraceae bacterium]|nr:baseplate J/gp47 family protein [Lachnospiraceae bacterium]
MVLTEKGFVRPTYDEILDRQINRAKKLFGEDIDTSSTSILGKYLRINVKDLDECYELLEDIYYARFPNTARGQSLDRLCPFAGVVRDPSTAARLQVRFHGEAGAIVPMGFLVSGGGSEFYADAEYSVGSEGFVDGYVYCTEPGIDGNISPDAKLSITNPVADLNSVELLEIVEYGSKQESDISLRLRFQKSVAGAGSATLDAIRGAVYRVPLVDSVSIAENKEDVTVDGRPPHSFECYVLAPESQDQLIADAIFSKKPLGIKTVGEVSIPVLDDANKSHIIRFSRTVRKVIRIRAVILTNQFFETTGQEQIKQNLMDYVNNLENGEAIYLSSLYGYIHDVHGVVNVPSLMLSDDGEEYVSGNIQIAEHEIARISAEDIELDCQSYLSRKGSGVMP